LSISIANAQNVSDEAMRYFDRGQAAVEMAKTPADYEDAVKEFENAATLAPDWPDVYYNLGLIQEKLGKYDNAFRNLTKYLELSPNASDVREVKKFIAKTEYKIEKVKAEQDKVKDLSGTWMGFIIRGKQAGTMMACRVVITVKNGVMEINTGHNQIGSAQFDGQKLKFKYFHDAWALQNECEYDMTIITDALMRGYYTRKIVGVRDSRDRDIVGEEFRILVELRKQ